MSLATVDLLGYCFFAAAFLLTVFVVEEVVFFLLEVVFLATDFCLEAAVGTVFLVEVAFLAAVAFFLGATVFSTVCIR